MALQNFDDFLADALEAAVAMREAMDKASAILVRHSANGYASLSSAAWGTGRPLTQAQYDALITSFGNYTDAFWRAPGYNGTNIEAALTEVPEG